MAAVETDRIVESVASRREEWLDVVCELIRIPSPNPPGDTREIARYVSDLLDDLGVPFERIAPRTEYPNIVAQFEGAGEAGPENRHLVFNGHLDTFPPREEDRWDRDPYAGVVEDGRIHGRGACDMHGGFTASLAAFFILYEHRDRFAGTVTLTAVSDEETGGQWGTEHLVENHPEYLGDAVVSGEPSSERIIRFSGRGVAWFEVTVRGIGAHTCSVPRGVSAVEVLIDYLSEIKQLPEEPSLNNLPDDAAATIRAAKNDMDVAYGEGATELALSPQVNIGTMSGGEKINLVAEHARCEVDVRIPLGSTKTEVEDYLNRTAERFPGEFDIDCVSYRNPTASDVSDPIFGALQRAGERVHGFRPSLSCGLAFTDCSFYREKGVSAAVYGPSPHNLGSQNEYIEVADFLDAVTVHTLASSDYMGLISSDA